MLQLAVVIGLCQQSRQQHQREEEDWSERRRHHTNYIHRQVIYLLHYDIHIQVYDHQPVPYIQVYVHQPSTTLPRFLSPSIVWYIGRGLNCPDEEVYYYEGYSYHLDVYRLLISIYHLHQIATLLILATAEGRRSQWLTYLMSFSNLLQKFYEVVLTPLSKTAPANCNTRMSNPIISILYTLTLFSPLLHPLLLSNYIGRIQIHSSVGRRK